eukprot:gene13496-9303_t
MIYDKLVYYMNMYIHICSSFLSFPFCFGVGDDEDDYLNPHAEEKLHRHDAASCLWVRKKEQRTRTIKTTTFPPNNNKKIKKNENEFVLRTIVPVLRYLNEVPLLYFPLALDPAF